MNVNEKVAVLTALEKAVKGKLKEVREDADDAAWLSWEEDGVEKRALKVGGQKVGEFVMTFSADGFAVTDKEAFEAFALDYGLASIRRTIRPEMMESAIKALEGVFDTEVMVQTVEERVVLSGDWERAMERVGDTVVYMDSGMVVPGASYRPKVPKATMVRGCKPEDVMPILRGCKPEDVMPIFRGLPGGVDALLLGGGEDD